MPLASEISKGSRLSAQMRLSFLRAEQLIFAAIVVARDDGAKNAFISSTHQSEKKS